MTDFLPNHAFLLYFSQNKGLILATTHLFFKPDADHIRLLQIGMILRELENIKNSVQQEFSGDFSIMLCGDFNSTPPFGVLEFIQSQKIAENHSDWKSSENPEEHVQDFCLKHSLTLDSACGTPKYTNYTIEFKDCLDYIFYQTEHLKVTNVIPFPSEEELSVHKGCPNVVFPSDHISCIADLKWI